MDRMKFLHQDALHGRIYDTYQAAPKLRSSIEVLLLLPVESFSSRGVSGLFVP